MPVPMEYRLASQHFEKFLSEVAEEAGLATRNQAYTTTQGVLLCFRRRLKIHDAIAFAQVLPAMLRALFVNDWDPEEAQVESWNREILTSEVQQLRLDHNFSPDTAIENVACVVRRHVDAPEFQRCLAKLPPPAQAFWS
ncbi:DUF2267 domain-containing protein [Pararhizobium antarcticum]|uniref:DUF2267 domain-containing protein n=1 Tax=Pararhizobium antarcticum TaxID=1798805 RepID=A0A657LLS5_9HYPH|nr:DUF2267 domain-containing protein [Pararhizobium antarcticum]OJF91346.1 hypothetical protein AX760_07470 [Pararhizobium antarcticum]